MPEIDLALAFTDFDREFGDLPAALLRNRIFEKNPTQAKQNVFLARPGSSQWGSYGSGRIRKIWSLPGLFGGALFFVSNETLYRSDPGGSTYAVTGIIYNDGDVSMCGVKGIDYQRLFIADGSVLQIYSGGTQASTRVTLSGNPSAGDAIFINNTYYQFEEPDTNLEVSDGLGNASNPWKVPLGADTEASIRNFKDAVEFRGTPGVDFSSNMGGQNTDVNITVVEDTVVTQFDIVAKVDTDAGNLIEVGEVGDTAGVIAFSATPNTAGQLFLSGGGVHGLNGIEVPDGLPPVKVATLKSFVLVAIGQSDRFYYVRPAQVLIDSLDFATSESQPDVTVGLEVVGDTAWFIGEASTEVWYATGQADTPFAPVNGRVYDRGAIQGTVVNIKGIIHLVGQDNIVYAIAGQPQRISHHGVEEVIRLQLESET